MKRLTTKCLVVAVIGILLALVTHAQAAPPTQSIKVVNTPLPVTVTNRSTPVPVEVLSDPTTGGIVNVTGNVNVANPAGSSVVTSIDNYPRTPVAGDVNSFASYTVPDGYRLVVETAVADVVCSPGSAHATASWIGRVVFGIPMQLLYTAPDGSSRYNGIVSARVVLGPGTFVGPEFVTCDTSVAFFVVTIFGYLVSVSSPSLAR